MTAPAPVSMPRGPLPGSLAEALVELERLRELAALDAAAYRAQVRHDADTIRALQDTVVALRGMLAGRVGGEVAHELRLLCGRVTRLGAVRRAHDEALIGEMTALCVAYRGAIGTLTGGAR